MKLYFTPGACSLSPNIALREAGLPFTLEKVDLRGKKFGADGGGDFLAVNPKGYVPALELDDGEILTEGAVLVQWIADQVPDRKLAPPNGTMARVRLQEWLHFIATELHKGLGPLYSPTATEEFKQTVRDRLAGRFAILDRGVGAKRFLLGDDFSVADGYAYYTLRSARKWAPAAVTPNLEAYAGRISERASVRAALEAEGLAL
ncbi:MAG: glutathione transferase GstA [Deltaproteobacteria bacterium]|nr:glutathione transferase GstA [Deltaproteobacteria bacterium]